MQQFTALSGLLISITSLALGVLVLISKYKQKVNVVFFLLALSLSLWGFGYYVFFSAGLGANAIIWSKIFMLGAVFIPSTYFHFTALYTERAEQYRVMIYANYLLSFIFSYLVLFSANFISNIGEKAWFTSWPNPGSYYVYFLIFFFLALASAIYILSRKPKDNSDNSAQLNYLIAGAAIGLVGGATNFPLWYDIAIPPIGNILVLAFPLSITYAILKTKLFNIKVLLTEFAVALVMVITLVQTITLTGTQQIMGLFLIGALGVGGWVLIKSVRIEVEKREEVERLAKEKIEALNELEERNRNLATLQKISDIVLNESDMKTMTQKILDELPNQLDSCVGGMLSIIKQGQLAGYSMSSNSFSKKIMSLVGGDLGKYSYPIKKDFNLIHKTIVNRKSQDSDKLSDFISPPISKTIATSIQKLTGARHVEAFPLVAGGEPFGVMLFVFNKNKEEVHTKNYSIAKAISDDMSLAIQRAQAFVQLKEANEYLSQLDKMKDEFISMASHELNTPLAAIEGYLSMILDEGMGKIDKQSRTYLNRAYASSKRLAELILDLLNVSRIEQGRLKMKYSKANMAELVQSVIHELQIKADEKKLYLKLQADKDVPETWCDPDRIREVIVNLTGNAIKFTEKGGVTINVKSASKKIVVDVTDTGRGIAKEDQSKLFQKFSQVKREIDEHQGTGLGLYISKNFVELHKGKINIISEVGKGSKFSFEIPVISKAPKEVEGAILDNSIKSTQIETQKKGDVPKIITDSSKGKV